MYSELVGGKPISFYQGDSFDREILFKKKFFDLIDKICISCSRLKLHKELIKDTTWEETIKGEIYKKFILSFSSTETQSFNEGKGTYDFQVTFSGDKVLSQVGILFEVLKRENPCSEV